MEERLELVEVVGHLPHASNTTVLALAADATAWVYKPERGEQPLWDFEWRTLAAREVLTFEVSAAMGIDVVPETRLAEGPYGPGSAQRFLEEDTEFDPRPMFNPRMDSRLWPIAVLDIVTNNADRKLGHLLHHRAERRLWAIDNGLTFHVEDKLRTVMWGFAGEDLPAELVAGLERLKSALPTGLGRRVADLLSPPEASALRTRVDNLLRDPVHPQPPTDRPPIPWPVW